MEVLTINGKHFVKATNVAREFGYTSDYIGQLARAGAIAAERVGRAWYVDREQVAAHKGEKRHSVSARARAGLVERVRAVERADDAVRPVSGISYHTDDAPLMPQIAHSTPREVHTPLQEFEVESVAEELVTDSTINVVQEIESHQVYRVPIRQVADIKKIPGTTSDEEIPSERRQIQKESQTPTVIFKKQHEDTFEHKYSSNVPYILAIGLTVVLLFTGMYTYTEGVAKRGSLDKNYGVSVDIVDALTAER